MISQISVKNGCPFIISVYIDELLFFADVIPDCKTHFKHLDSGSVRVSVLDGRQKVIFDLWLSMEPDSRYILEVFEHSCFLTSFAPS